MQRAQTQTTKYFIAHPDVLLQIHHQTLFAQLLKLLFDNGNTETKLMSQLFSRDQSMSPEIAQKEVAKRVTDSMQINLWQRLW